MGKITVAGVGCDADQLTLRAAKLLKGGGKVILHTQECGCADWLREHGIAFSTLDHLYESYDDFDAHARAAAAHVSKEAETGDVVYCVLDLRDESAVILAQSGATLVPGPPAEGALTGFAGGETLHVPASRWEEMAPDAARATLVREIDTRALASEVKLRLMEAYADDAPVLVSRGEGIARIALYALDRLDRYDHRMCALILPEHDLRKRASYSMRDLVSLARGDECAYQHIEFDALCDIAVQLAGAAAHAEDRGLFHLRDIIADACADLLDAP